MNVGRQPSARWACIKPLAVRADFRVAAKQLGMDEVDRADVERRRHARATLQGDEALDKVEARATEIKAAVDMSGLDVEKTRRVHRLGEANEQPHRERRRLAMLAL